MKVLDLLGSAYDAANGLVITHDCLLRSPNRPVLLRPELLIADVALNVSGSCRSRKKPMKARVRFSHKLDSISYFHSTHIHALLNAYHGPHDTIPIYS